MDSPESLLLNKTDKLHFDSETQTLHLISGRRPDIVIVNKKEYLPNRGHKRPKRPQSENKRIQEKRKIPKLC